MSAEACRLFGLVTKAHLATLMFWYEPKMCILVSAMTILVFVAFSIVNLVLPFCTAMASVVSSESCWLPLLNAASWLESYGQQCSDEPTALLRGSKTVSALWDGIRQCSKAVYDAMQP